jgi:hypothetical protein
MVSAELAERFARAGIQMVTPTAGRAAFVEELLGGGAESEVILGGPIPQDSETGLQTARLPILGGLQKYSRTNGSLELVLKTSSDTHAYLLDHQLDGTPVMPMAMVLELAAEVAASAWPDMHVTAVRNVQVLHGITYDNGRARALRVQASAAPPRIDGTVLLDVAVHSEGESGRPHYRAQVEMRRAAAPAPSVPPLQLVNPRRKPVSVEHAYASWLFHGPRFAGIVDIEATGENGITGMLRCSSPADMLKPSPEGEWLIDPVVIDSGLQLLIVWARERLDQTPLPSQLGCYHRVRAPRGGIIRGEAEIHHTPGNPVLRTNLRFHDDAGLVGWMEDMRVTCSRELNRLSEMRIAAAEA